MGYTIQYLQMPFCLNVVYRYCTNVTFVRNIHCLSVRFYCSVSRIKKIKHCLLHDALLALCVSRPRVCSSVTIGSSIKTVKYHYANNAAQRRRRKLLGRAGRGRLPVFGTCGGPPLSLPRQLLSPILNITYYISAVLHSHYNVLASPASKMA